MTHHPAFEDLPRVDEIGKFDPQRRGVAGRHPAVFKGLPRVELDERRSGGGMGGRAMELSKHVLEFNDAKPRLARTYLVKGWLNRGAFSVVFGEPKAGKSFVAMDLAAHVAAAKDWHGFPVSADGAGRVLYCALEGGAGFDNRLAALREGRPELAKAIERRRTLATLKTGFDMHGDGDIEALLELLSCHPSSPGLIVLDTLARAMGAGDENSAQDMGALIRNVDRIREATGAHVMLVHHSGKDRDRGARGHSSLKAAVDTEIHVTRDGDVCTAATTCQRDIPDHHEFHYRLRRVALGQDEDGDEVTSAVVEVTEAGSRRYRVSGKPAIALEALSEALVEHGTTIRGPDFPSCPVVALEAWRATCDRHGLTDADTPDARKKAFQRARATLHEKAVIREHDNYVWRTESDG